jgi:hypothetical protein
VPNAVAGKDLVAKAIRANSPREPRLRCVIAFTSAGISAAPILFGT